MAPFHLFPTRSTVSTLDHGWMYSGQGEEKRGGEERGGERRDVVRGCYFS